MLSLYVSFLSEHNTDIHIYIHIMQYSKEMEDFPLHEQLLAAGQDNVPYQSISISRYILSLSLSLSCTNTPKFGLCNVPSSTGRKFNNQIMNDNPH